MIVYKVLVPYKGVVQGVREATVEADDVRDLRTRLQLADYDHRDILAQDETEVDVSYMVITEINGMKQ